MVINNAGIFVPKPFTEYTSEDFLRVVSTNLAGFFYVAQEAARHMRHNGRGQILTISTTRAKQPVAGINAALTNLTKGGLDSVTRALAIEYAAEGIRVSITVRWRSRSPLLTRTHRQSCGANSSACGPRTIEPSAMTPGICRIPGSISDSWLSQNQPQIEWNQTMHSIDNLKKLSRFGELAPEATNAFWVYDKVAFADGAIPTKVQGTHGDRRRSHHAVCLLHRAASAGSY